MPHLPAAILILADRSHPDKQRVVAFAAAAAEPLIVYTLCYTYHACVALLRNGLIGAVVSALDPGESARDAIEAAGGQLIVAREQANRLRRDVNQLAVRMYKSGIDTQEISKILQVNSGDVRGSLFRAGILRRRKRE